MSGTSNADKNNYVSLQATSTGSGSDSNLESNLLDNKNLVKDQEGISEDAKVDEAKVDEAKVDEAKIDEAKIDEAKIDDPLADVGAKLYGKIAPAFPKEDSDVPKPLLKYNKALNKHKEKLKENEEDEKQVDFLKWDLLSGEIKEEYIKSYAVWHVWEQLNKKVKEDYPLIYKRAEEGANFLKDECLEAINQSQTWNTLNNKEEIILRMHPKDAAEEEKRKSAGKIDISSLEDAYTFDYAIVFHLIKSDGSEKSKLERDDHCKKLASVLDYLRFAELKTTIFLAEDEDDKSKIQVIICLIGASEARLQKEAERVEFDVLLDYDHLRTMESFVLTKNVLSQNNSLDTSLFLHNYGVFRRFSEEKNEDGQMQSDVYSRYNDTPYRPDSFFSELVRLKLTQSIIEAETELGGAALSLRAYCRSGNHPANAFFALHEPADRKALNEKFSQCCSVMKDPCCCGNKVDSGTKKSCCSLDFVHSEIHWKIRHYFGENVSLYFEFLSHLTVWLFPVAILGTFFFIAQLVEIINGDEISIGNYVFGFIMIGWATFFLESWKRVENGLAAKWGMSSFEDKESVRPEFSGDFEASPVTGEKEEVENDLKHFGRLLFSQSIVTTYIMLVVLVVAGLLFAKIAILRAYADSWVGSVLPAVLNALVIMIFNKVYERLAIFLNDFENHRTESEYENSKISKSFVFKAWNSYNSLLIIAFLKRNLSAFGFCKSSYLYTFRRLKKAYKTCGVGSEFCNITEKFISGLNPPIHHAGSIMFDDLPIGKPSFVANPQSLNNLVLENSGQVSCDSWKLWNSNTTTWGTAKPTDISPLKDHVCGIFALLYKHLEGYNFRGNCILELTLQLAILFSTQIIVGNITEVVIPYIKTSRNLKKAVEENQHLSMVEQELFFDQYEGTFADYDELVVQFGYVMLFVVAFPAAPLLAFINNLIEFQVDGLKLTKMTRRPYPMGAQDIGNWYSTLNILSIVGIPINLGLLFIVPSNVIPHGDAKFDVTTRYLIFLLLEHVAMSLKFTVASLLPDKPKWVDVHLRRQEFITDVLIRGEHF